jgi:uncharacterized membrane protein YwzB
MSLFGILGAIVFVVSIVVFIESGERLFPRAATVARMIIAIIIALLCVAVAFFSLDLMNAHGNVAINWSIAVALCAVYIAIRVGVTRRRGHTRESSEN